MGLREQILAENEAARRRRSKTPPGKLREHILSVTTGVYDRNLARNQTSRSRTSIPSSSSLARDEDPEPGSQAIASPLKETDVTTRTFHPEATVLSTDGLFAVELTPVKQIFMQDASGQEVEFEYGDQFAP